MEYTQNYALIKPEGTDECSNEPLNMNADEIDRVMHELQEQLDLHDSELDAKLGRTETAAAAVCDGAGGNIADALGIIKTTLGTSCKNYLQVNCPLFYKNGVTVTPNDDGSITINDTSTTTSAVFAYANFRTGTSDTNAQYDYYRLLPPGDYVLSGTGASNVRVQVCAMTSDDPSTVTVIGSAASKPANFTVAEDHIYTWARLYLQNANSQTYDNITFYPMIRRADVADDSFDAYKPSLQTQIDELRAQNTALETRIAALELATE